MEFDPQVKFLQEWITTGTPKERRKIVGVLVAWTAVYLENPLSAALARRCPNDMDPKINSSRVRPELKLDALHGKLVVVIRERRFGDETGVIMRVAPKPKHRNSHGEDC